MAFCGTYYDLVINIVLYNKQSTFPVIQECVTGRVICFSSPPIGAWCVYRELNTHLPQKRLAPQLGTLSTVPLYSGYYFRAGRRVECSLNRDKMLVTYRCQKSTISLDWINVETIHFLFCSDMETSKFPFVWVTRECPNLLSVVDILFFIADSQNVFSVILVRVF